MFYPPTCAASRCVSSATSLVKTDFVSSPITPCIYCDNRELYCIPATVRQTFFCDVANIRVSSHQVSAAVRQRYEYDGLVVMRAKIRIRACRFTRDIITCVCVVCASKYHNPAVSYDATECQSHYVHAKRRRIGRTQQLIAAVAARTASRHSPATFIIT